MSASAAAFVVAAVAAGPFGARTSAQNAPAVFSSDAACQTLTPASVGGPQPKNPNLVVIRWLGHSNFEIAYRDTVILADSWFDRGPGSHPIGVIPKDFKKADAILIGHAHFDHIADAPDIAKQTGAQVIGAAISTDYVKTKGLRDVQITTVTGKGGEHLEIKNILVQPVLGRHNVIGTTVPPGYMEKTNAAMAAASLDKPLTDAEKLLVDAMRTRGSRDPKISDEGTIGYLLTIGGFRVMVADSPGPVTDYQRQMMQQAGTVDVALLSLVSMDAGIPPLVDLIKMFKPSTVFIGHHDGEGTMHWASTFLAATAIRDALPTTRTLEVPYRTPVCYNTTTKEMFVGL